MSKASPRLRKKKLRAVVAAHHARLRAAGFVPMYFWVPQEVRARGEAEAIRLGALLQSVFRAALESGLRNASTSDIVRVQREWIGIAGLGFAPRRPGAPHKLDREPLLRWQRQQKRLKEKAA